MEPWEAQKTKLLDDCCLRDRLLGHFVTAYTIFQNFIEIPFFFENIIESKNVFMILKEKSIARYFLAREPASSKLKLLPTSELLNGWVPSFPHSVLNGGFDIIYSIFAATTKKPLL